LAIPHPFYQDFFEDVFFKEVVDIYALKIVTFDEVNAKIKIWKS
jgi:hypothetical protein